MVRKEKDELEPRGVVWLKLSFLSVSYYNSILTILLVGSTVTATTTEYSTVTKAGHGRPFTKTKAGARHLVSPSLSYLVSPESEMCSLIY